MKKTLVFEDERIEMSEPDNVCQTVELNEEKTMSEITLGEKRVRMEFNVNDSSLSEEIKRKSANLIDLLENVKNETKHPDKNERNRLLTLAQTAYEEAAMWAVHAVAL